MINEGLASASNTGVFQCVGRLRKSTELTKAENNCSRWWIRFAGLLHQTRYLRRVQDEASPIQTQVKDERNATNGIHFAGLFIARPASETQNEITDVSL